MCGMSVLSKRHVNAFNILYIQLQVMRTIAIQFFTEHAIVKMVKKCVFDYQYWKQNIWFGYFDKLFLLLQLNIKSSYNVFTYTCSKTRFKRRYRLSELSVLWSYSMCVVTAHTGDACKYREFFRMSDLYRSLYGLLLRKRDMPFYFANIAF